MQDRYWMFLRKGVFYVQDKLSGKQKSLKTRDAAAAKRMLAGKNQATEQPQMNLAMAKVYLSCKSDEMLARTWDDVMKEMEQAYTGSTLARWRTQIKSVPFQGLRKLPLLHTESSHFLSVLRHPRAGTSTQKWLRILHNRALDLGWILAPVMARRIWPKLKTKRAKAITADQHARLIAAEKDDEFRHYLQMLWEIGGAQTDTARLHRDNVDLFNRRVTYNRQKLESIGQGSVAIVIGDDLMKLLNELPQEGYLFPTMAQQNDKVRASRFRKVADRLGFTEISLHSYRYAWAQRAKSYGMPLREAMAHLGHGSKAVHYAYSDKAEIVSLPLEFYEKQWKEKIIQFAKTAAA
jgi:Phage integrase family